MAKNKKVIIWDETVYKKIINGAIKIKELDLTSTVRFNSALKALYERKAFVKDLNPNDAGEKALLLKWLRDDLKQELLVDKSNDDAGAKANLTLEQKIACLNSKLFICEKEHNNDIIKTFLYLKLTSAIKDGDVDEEVFKVYKSLKDDLIIRIESDSKDGEEIVFFDKELQVPLGVKTRLAVTLKITDPYKFINFIDVHVQQINKKMILSAFLADFFSALKAVALNVIKSKDVRYFELSKYYAEISSILASELQAKYVNCGIEITNANLINTYRLNDAAEAFEKHHFELAMQEKSALVQHQKEILALENYEKKADIHNRYPNFAIGLTEEEKNNAIDRYLIKTSGVKPKVDTSYEKQGLEERKTDIGKFERPEDVSPWVAGKIKGKLTPICISIIILLLALAAGMYFYLAIPIYYSLIPVALAVATAAIWIVKLVAYKRVKKPKQKKA